MISDFCLSLSSNRTKSLGESVLTCAPRSTVLASVCVGTLLASVHCQTLLVVGLHDSKRFQIGYPFLS